MRQKKTPAQVTAKAPEDGEFPELKNLSYKEMYNISENLSKKPFRLKEQN